MALTGSEETDLLLPLMRGKREETPFATFLERLRRRTGATFATILVHLAEDRDVLSFFVGPDIVRRSHELQLDEVNLVNRIQYDRLRPGRVYGSDEFDDHDHARKARRARDMRKLGLVDQRAVRLLAEDRLDAWLVIASDRVCTASDSALLSSLAPYAAEAVRDFVQGERQKLAETHHTQGLHRAGAGWIVFDKSAQVLAIAPTTAELLSRGSDHAVRVGQRLRDLSHYAGRALTEAAAEFDRAPDSPPRALVLLEEPRVEAVLMASTPASRTRIEAPAMVAYCRQDRRFSHQHAEHLARLYELPRREAELAVLLADGRSLGEAGSEMGLTIETTRNYSKRLFAKMGVRGQVDLVRAVLESCAVLG